MAALATQSNTPAAAGACVPRSDAQSVTKRLQSELMSLMVRLPRPPPAARLTPRRPAVRAA